MELKNNDFSIRIKKNTHNLGIWTGAWVISIALVTFGAKFLWDFDEVISLVTIILNLVLGIGMIIAYKRYLKGQDELQRKIEMDALALALGAGVIGAMSYSLLEVVNLVSFDGEISHLLIFISITYLLAVFVGTIRYR